MAMSKQRNFSERSRMESAIEKVLTMGLDKTELPDNFYGPIVDIYNSYYGKICHVTFLFKDSFTQKDSDELFHNFKNWKNRIKKVFGEDTFPGSITSSTSTIDVYKKSSKYYDENK